MKLTWVLFLSTAVAAAQNAAPEATAAPTATSAPESTASAGRGAATTTNLSSVGQALCVLSTHPTPNAELTQSRKSFSLPMPTLNPDGQHMGNISPPPPSLVNQVITAVPPSALLEIINPTKRRTLAEQIRAGSTPGWYSSLPPDVRDYMGVVRSQVQDGALTKPTTASTTAGSGSGSGSGGSGGDATATETGSSESNAANGGGDRMPGLGLVEMVAVGVAMML